jgi:hypothetical protein
LNKTRWNSVLVSTGLLIAMAVPATATNFSFQGSFTKDDDLEMFRIVLDAPSTITLHTLSYGGGTNQVGTVIPRGGFDPILSLFLGTGPAALLIGLNNDGTCPPLTTDSVTGACWDSYLQSNLPAGVYTAVITQSDNGPLGPFLGDGFLRTGQGNFTGPAFSGQPGSFIDANLSQRTANWSLDMLDVDNVARIPEPGSMLLVLTGSVLLSRRFRQGWANKN